MCLAPLDFYNAKYFFSWFYTIYTYIMPIFLFESFLCHLKAFFLLDWKTDREVRCISAGQRVRLPFCAACVQLCGNKAGPQDCRTLLSQESEKHPMANCHVAI